MKLVSRPYAAAIYLLVCAWTAGTARGASLRRRGSLEQVEGSWSRALVADLHHWARQPPSDEVVDGLSDAARGRAAIPPIDGKDVQEIKVVAPTLPPAWKEMGVKINKNDDWLAFLIAFATNSLVLLACVLVFSYLRQRYRLVYQKNSWDNWGYSPAPERTPIEDSQRGVLEDLQESWPKVTRCGNPLPSRPPGTLFDWMLASWHLRTHEVIGCAGLDQAMLLQLANMGMIVFATVGLPMFFIMGPVHAFFGGNAAGEDYLSWQGFANVRKGSPLCWIHAFLVWIVVFVVDHHIYHCQASFVRLRVAWMKQTPHIEACTILVEGVPRRCMTRTKLAKYFNDMFEGREVVHTVHFIVHTKNLMDMIAARDAAKKALHASKAKQDRMGPTASETVDLTRLLTTSVSELERKYATAQAAVISERFRLRSEMKKLETEAEKQCEGPADDEDSGEDVEAAQTETATADASKAAVKIQRFFRYSRTMSGEAELGVGSSVSGQSSFGFRSMFRKHVSWVSPESQSLYCSTAFVTFKTRFDANMALRLVPYTPDRAEFIVSVPPDPADIVYTDFQKNPLKERARTAVGYTLIALVAMMFLPTIAFISSSSNLNYLETRLDWIKELQKHYPKVCGFWNGIAGALGLTIVTGFLPTILVLISTNFFKLKAHAWAQHAIQRWYFLFLLVFQLLVVSIVNSVWAALSDAIANPISIVERLSMGMCRTTHFFLSFFLLQWGTIGMEHTRYVQLMKYLLMKKIYDTPEEAAACAEPEDQDYYGMGARIARYTALFVLGIAFISLCPLIAVLAFINFFLIRLFVGYQVVFAETRKPDLGGRFWVTALKHIQVGLVVYVLCMTGVLMERSPDSKYPSWIAGASLVYLAESMLTFDGKFHWQSLSHQEVMATMSEEQSGAARDMRQATRETYEQPELLEESDEQ